MSKVLQSRFWQMVIVVFILMAVLAIRLFALTVIQNDEWSASASSLSIKSVYTPAPRGEILDRYGKVLAGNEQSFSVRLSATDLKKEEVNDIALTLINILEANGDQYFDNFPILLENGGYVYTYQKEIEEWLQSQGMPPYYTAEQAFNRLREVYNIGESLDQYEAQSELQNIYKIFPPISVKNMKFSRNLDKESFLGRYYGEDNKHFDYNMTAEEAFLALRKNFEISEALSDEDARKVMIVRNELSSLGYLQFVPATIATDVSDETIVLLEENSRNLPGVEVVSETVRVYPNFNTASHILGYLGHISERDKAKYVDELGYNPNDMIGLDGIEGAYESTLKGKDGTKYVQVNVSGELVKVIDDVEPVKGKDVYLTVDLELQKTAEEALKKALSGIQSGGMFESVYGNYYYTTPYRNANVGAVVAIEVETGDVLAMASYPDYDPNLFSEGISKSDWNALQSTNPRDQLSPRPLYNVAAKSAVQPGSTFKMVTATAALESGLDPNKKLHDGGFVMVGNRSYGCLAWNRSRSSHGSINLAEALEVSCNYYFYDISTGRDYYTGKSLGYHDPIDIEKIMSYAQQYGLGKSTGIEIGEMVTGVPSAAKKMASQKNLLSNVLMSNAEIYFKPEVIADKALLKQNIAEIVSWMDENPSRKVLIERMAEVDVKEDMIVTVAERCKFDYFNQAAWTRGDEFNIAIGQGENSYTPLQMANYIATIGNGGIHNKVSLISAIEGQGKIEKEPGTKIDISDEAYLTEIIKGMKLVATGPSGSLSGIFRSFPVAVAAKTGTAENTNKIPPVDEVEYVKTNLSRIAPNMKWADVEIEMVRLMSEYPETYTSRDSAVKQAVHSLSGGKITSVKINSYKSSYDNYAWVLAMAPADDPKIAVAVLVFQGGTSLYAAPVAREVIGEYLQLDKTYQDLELNTKMN